MRILNHRKTGFYVYPDPQKNL